MSRNRLRIIATSAALVVTLVALGLTLFVALQPPTGPGGGPTLYDCTVFNTYAQIVVLMSYYSCLLVCERRYWDNIDAKALCINNCLLGFILMEITVMLMYIACLLNLFF